MYTIYDTVILVLHCNFAMLVEKNCVLDHLLRQRNAILLQSYQIKDVKIVKTTFTLEDFVIVLTFMKTFGSAIYKKAITDTHRLPHRVNAGRRHLSYRSNSKETCYGLRYVFNYIKSYYTF